MVWDLRGNEQQNAIIKDALNRCDFPFNLLVPKLNAETGRSVIPVEWDDLSRYAAQLESQKLAGGHFHIHENGDTAEPIERRERVLGLAWYSGKVTIEQTLVSEPELAKEVFLSEGAHMVDFFYMTNEHRIAIWNAVHPDSQHIPAGTNIEDGLDLGHGHGWFDIASYREWVGEEFMGLFVRAFSNVSLSIWFAHQWDTNAIEQVRAALLPQPEPSPFFAKKGSKVYHDTHKGLAKNIVFRTVEEARSAGLRPCKTCKP